MYKYSTNGELNYSKLIYEHMQGKANKTKMESCVMCTQAIPQCENSCKKCEIVKQTCSSCSYAKCLDDKNELDDNETGDNLKITASSVDFTDLDSDKISYKLEDNLLVRYTNNENPLKVLNIFYSQYTGEIITDHGKGKTGNVITATIVKKENVMEVISNLNKLSKNLTQNKVNIINLYDKIVQEIPEVKCPEVKCPEVKVTEEKKVPSEEKGGGMGILMILAIILFVKLYLR